mgnify:CR=1 FL=1
MSETTIDAEWAAALKQAAAIDDYDARYGLCERFLNRALIHVAIDHDSLIKVACAWYTRNRRDRECAVVAQRLLSTFWTVDIGRPTVEIIAGFDAEDLVDPEHVGRVCADAAYDATHYTLLSTHRRAGVLEDKSMADRVESIALDNERRLQMLDVREELVLLARWKGAAK